MLFDGLNAMFTFLAMVLVFVTMWNFTLRVLFVGYVGCWLVVVFVAILVVWWGCDVVDGNSTWADWRASLMSLKECHPNFRVPNINI